MGLGILNYGNSIILLVAATWSLYDISNVMKDKEQLTEVSFSGDKDEIKNHDKLKKDKETLLNSLRQNFIGYSIWIFLSNLCGWILTSTQDSSKSPETGLIALNFIYLFFFRGCDGIAQYIAFRRYERAHHKYNKERKEMKIMEIQLKDDHVRA